MTDRGEQTLVIVGPMAAGKTSIGKKVARMLETSFLDSDRLIVAEHGPIPDIFQARGEAEFRRIEREVIEQTLGAHAVFALGGGAVIDPETRRRLAQQPVVFLTVSADAVAERIRGGGRPLLQGGGDQLASWQRILDERRAWYEEVADLTVDTSRAPMGGVAEQIADWWRKK